MDWLALTVRWMHVVFGAAWIGTSFYFNWMNNHVRPLDEPRSGVTGELWSIHGGKFYQVLKYDVVPEKLPKTLHWFKWEAYLTWISGITLLVLVYYADAHAYLIDPRVRTLEPWQAIGAGIGSLVAGWFVYDLLCRSPIAKHPLLFTVIGGVLVVACVFGYTQLFGGRAAYIHVGALIGTWMAGNVFRVIIPNQHVTVAALMKGETPDRRLGDAAALRSLHNNYFALPVLFIMVSSHYPLTFAHEHNWAILAVLSIVGAGVRHSFNLRGQGRSAVWILPAGAAVIVGLALVTAPRSYADAPPVAFADVRKIIEARCITCHSVTPTHETFRIAPLGITYDAPEHIPQLASRINYAVVVTKSMPLGNFTAMTEHERDLIGAWYFQGAKGP